MHFRKLNPVALASLTACLAVSCDIPGSNNNATYSDEVLEALSVVPATALDATKKGEFNANSFSYASSDAFFNNTYVLHGTGDFELVAYNGAPKNASDLALVDDKLQILHNLNDLEDAQLIVSAKDLKKIQSISINGKAVAVSAFTFGQPSLPNGEQIKAGNRFPTDYTSVSVGELKAQEFIPLNVQLVGECGATIHLDIAGKPYCEKTLTTSPVSGTTLTLDGPQCDIPDCTEHPEDPRCQKDCTAHPEDPRCQKDCDLYPLDPQCEKDCLAHPEDPRCHEGPGCTRTIGFWKNHSGCPATYPNVLLTLMDAPENKCHDECTTSDLITSLLPIWLGTPNGPTSIEVTNNTIAIRILEQHYFGSPDNGITKLYAQLLAAKANIVQGANPDVVTLIIQLADDFLATHNHTFWYALTDDQKEAVELWHTALDNYNNGIMGPGHCQ